MLENIVKNKQINKMDEAMGEILFIHHLMLVPKYLVIMEVCSWIEPKRDSLLPKTLTICKHICLQQILLCLTTQKLKIELIML